MSHKVPKVCIIDDDEVYIFGLKRMMLKKELCDDILVFYNGQEALDYFHTITLETALPNLIFLDINMPIVDGWQFLEEYEKLKTGFSNPIPIYMASSSVDNRDLTRAKSYESVTEYLAKPIKLATLESILE